MSEFSSRGNTIIRPNGWAISTSAAALGMALVACGGGAANTVPNNTVATGTGAETSLPTPVTETSGQTGRTYMEIADRRRGLRLWADNMGSLSAQTPAFMSFRQAIKSYTALLTNSPMATPSDNLGVRL